MPVPSQDKLPPLPNPDENYVIPIDDAPAADYVNGDVVSPGWPGVPKPKKCLPAPKVQAKPSKPPITPKPEPKGLISGLAKKLAISSGQALFPRTGLEPLSSHWCCPALPLGVTPRKGAGRQHDRVNSEKNLRLGCAKVSLWEAKTLSSLLITPSPTL
ncbi:signal transducing adaptor family member 2 [Phyllostomus discolor]|uniref:Signal transducing adaptor family member 2 n=1 Tax=Phyllostomus discolor TaxID=89673 RepID=A0A833ZR92_9CHIR|nr:signal transducing adaptor family member 2 [Phyllostomus discolor]